jgi:hypothetical protein
MREAYENGRRCAQCYSAAVSYDLYAIPVEAGQDPALAFDTLMEAQERDQSGWTEERVERAERIAASLQRRNPRLQRFVFDYAEIAKRQGVSDADARSRFRHIELNAPEGDNPIQVTIHADHAYLTMPFWHTGDRARATMSEALSYLALMSDEAGWKTFDPQLRRVVSLTSDLDQATAAYEAGGRKVQEMARSAAAPAKEPPSRKRRFGLF